MTFKEQFYILLDQFHSSPFLFLGSGFSFRYLNTDRWENLLRKFSNEINVAFEKYRSGAASNLPKVGSLLAKDYHTAWFESDIFKEQREIYKQEMIDIDSPLKASISNLLKDASSNKIPEDLEAEIEFLKSAKIDGIITTNYDLLCERIFPEFTAYKSQRELIFSTIHEVGEIYKIHGCCSEPNSIVLTAEDYKDFDDNNSYLAAKLLTVFLEHPTIFIGYSLTDSNVRLILRSIIKCLDQAQINELSKRLFFVQFNPNVVGEPLIEKYELEIGGGILPLTRISANSYSLIYEVLTNLTQKFSATILRKIKKHIYELILTNDPAGKIKVVDFDNDIDLDSVDVVIGVGISEGNGVKGYEAFTRFDIANDFLDNTNAFNPLELCNKSLSKMVKGRQWMPICKYVTAVDNKEDIDKNLLSAYGRPIVDWKTGNPYVYKRESINDSYSSMDELILHNPPEKSLSLILLLNFEKIDLDSLKNFLLENRNLMRKNALTSHYMKLLSLYDRLVYNP